MSNYNFNNILNHFEFTEIELASVLFDTNAFISGSSALNVYTQDNIYDNMDLDIFVTLPYKTKTITYNYEFETYVYKKIEALVKSKKYKDVKNRYTASQERFTLSHKNKDVNEIEYFKSDLANYIKCIKTFYKKNKKVQIIYIYDNPIDVFLNTFDLNICKLAIKSNGSKLELYSNHLSKLEKQEIIDRKMYIVKPLYKPNLESRIQKYVNRGFIFYDNKVIDSKL